MIVKHNITAMNSNRMLGLTTSSQAKSTEKLSSGYKINRAADDAAGLSISEKMRRQVRGLTQAAANAQDGISVVQTAEGALNEVEDMLQRMNELAVKGENGTLTTTERSSIQAEVKQLMSEVDRVQSTTTFNEMNLLDGSFIKGLQVGAEAGQHIDIEIKNMSMAGLADRIGDLYDPVMYNDLTKKSTTYKETGYAKSTGNNTDTIIGTVKNGTTDTYEPGLSKTQYAASDAKTIYEKAMNLKGGDTSSVFKQDDFNDLNAFVKGAITLVSMQRSDLGAIQNRLEHT
ncbi:MAG: hypothetical protein NC302_07425, partial [Bacteroidales bacterium]|nr:hypothetical protein [Bacteroidales bacterium]